MTVRILDICPAFVNSRSGAATVEVVRIQMETMGPFKLEAVLGRGGMGTVYRAKHSETNELLALKVLSPAYTADDHFRNRFESEIKALLKLDHPNVVRLSSYGQYEHNLYFAMELVEGKSLFQMQRDGEIFHWREVIRIAKNVALGLRHAHDRGVIHRDLKPGNLLRAITGIIKITDFGIAKSFGSDQNTGTNVLGTVDFMSPEQARGLPVTFKSDLYSLGAVMYTLLGGKPPFSGNSVEEAMRNLTRVPAPRISRLAPDVPKVLDDLVAQLLDKEPENRIQTALSLYHQLKRAEKSLKDTSQAPTAERPGTNESDKTSFLVGPSTSVEEKKEHAQTIANESDELPSESMPSSVTPTREDAPSTSQTGPELIKAEEKGKDYYTKVTDDERMVHLDLIESEEESSTLASKLLLGATLLLVVGLITGGVFWQSQVPSADALLAEIQKEWDNPHKKYSEIELFIDNYNKHEKIDEVKNRLELALATRKFYELRRESKKKEGLSAIESGFLEIMDNQTADVEKTFQKLQAFVTLYAAEATIENADKECIDAARAYLEPTEKKAKHQQETVLRDIEKQLDRADNLPNKEAFKVYQSVIDLNSEFEWAAHLVQQAKIKIETRR